MFWFLSLIVLGFAFVNPSEARRPTAYVVGTVYCDTCFQDDFSRNSRFISGALVAVECRGKSSRFSFREEVKTNKDGKFKAHLPFSVTKHVKRLRSCSVELIRSSEPYCAVASTARSSSLRLKSRKPGAHIFSAGFFTFKPLRQPTVCNQKPSIGNGISEQSSTSDDPTFAPPLRDPPTPLLGRNPLPALPALPNLPVLPQLPGLPQLPLLPGLSRFPPNLRTAENDEGLTKSEASNEKNLRTESDDDVLRKSESSKGKNLKTEENGDVLRKSEASNENFGQEEFFTPLPQFPPLLPATPPISAVPLPQLPPLFPSPPPASRTPLPPNPFLPPKPVQSPPSVVPPNPFQPPPSVFPPNPFQPPPSVLPANPFQPTPPLISAPTIPGLSPTPPAPTAPSLPLPPFPFQPSPGFPTPASSSPTLKEASP